MLLIRRERGIWNLGTGMHTEDEAGLGATGLESLVHNTNLITIAVTSFGRLWKILFGIQWLID